MPPHCSCHGRARTLHYAHPLLSRRSFLSYACYITVVTGTPSLAMKEERRYFRRTIGTQRRTIYQHITGDGAKKRCETQAKQQLWWVGDMGKIDDAEDDQMWTMTGDNAAEERAEDETRVGGGATVFIHSLPLSHTELHTF
ncbi:peptidase S9 [Sesbania bispinosa]|nr:peptidase S9 [Sesbania bispinosa]